MSLEPSWRSVLTLCHSNFSVFFHNFAFNWSFLYRVESDSSSERLISSLESHSNSGGSDGSATRLSASGPSNPNTSKLDEAAVSGTRNEEGTAGSENKSLQENSGEVSGNNGVNRDWSPRALSEKLPELEEAAREVDKVDENERSEERSLHPSE